MYGTLTFSASLSDAKGQTRRVTNLAGPLKTQVCLGFVMLDPLFRRLCVRLQVG